MFLVHCGSCQKITLLLFNNFNAWCQTSHIQWHAKQKFGMKKAHSMRLHGLHDFEAFWYLYSICTAKGEHINLKGN